MRLGGAQIAVIPTLLLAAVSVHVSVGPAQATLKPQSADPCGDREVRGQRELPPRGQLLSNEELQSAVDLALETSADSMRRLTGLITTGSRKDSTQNFRNLTHKYVQDVNGNWRLEHGKEYLWPYPSEEFFAQVGLETGVEYWDVSGQQYLRPIVSIKGRKTSMALKYLNASKARWTTTTTPLLDGENAYLTPVDALPDPEPYDGSYVALVNGGTRYEFTQCWKNVGFVPWARTRTTMTTDSRGRVTSISQETIESAEYSFASVETRTNFEYPLGGAQVGIPSPSKRVPFEEFLLAVEAAFTPEKILYLHDAISREMQWAYGIGGNSIPPERLPLGRWEVMDTLKEVAKEEAGTGYARTWRIPALWRAKGDVLEVWITNPFSKEKNGFRYTNRYNPKRAVITVSNIVSKPRDTR